MFIKTIIRRNDYHDSVYLMGLARQVGQGDGVKRVALVMGTATNKALLKDVGLLDDAAGASGANDLVIAIAAENDAAISWVQAEVERRLGEKHKVKATHRECRTLEAACAMMPGANLAMVSLPGAYAATEAFKALSKGLNVFMFSDDIALDEEVMLKRLACEKGLLMMGPGCGLTYPHQVAVGLASKVKSGSIGVIAASGSGMQETMVLLDRAGEGVSQAIGAGGRDLKDEVGGLTTLCALELLEADEATKVIVLISKPPGVRTTEKVLERIRNCRKPVVVNFIGGKPEQIEAAGAQSAATFDEAAAKAVSLARGETYVPRPFGLSEAEVKGIIEKECAGFGKCQRYLRGLYCGGTLAEEAMMVMRPWLPSIHSNTALQTECALADARVSVEHSMIDIGTEDFTRGKPHAAIDPSPRIARFTEEARDPEVAVILLDFLLGYGCHSDPAGIMAKPITEALTAVRMEGRRLAVVASICGTEHDPQRASRQRKHLADAGVIVMPSNAQAARLAGMIAAAASEARKDNS